jgi:hypothetical protein
MITLAVDPGKTSGWAVSEPRLSGSVDLEHAAVRRWRTYEKGTARAAWARELEEGERLRRVLGEFDRWLGQLLLYHSPDLLIVERQKPFRLRQNTHVLEFRGAALAASARVNVATVECPPEKWRALLNGRAYDPAKDHQIAAELMLDWWRSR